MLTRCLPNVTHQNGLLLNVCTPHSAQHSAPLSLVISIYYLTLLNVLNAKQCLRTRKSKKVVKKNENYVFSRTWGHTNIQHIPQIAQLAVIASLFLLNVENPHSANIQQRQIHPFSRLGRLS